MTISHRVSHLHRQPSQKTASLSLICECMVPATSAIVTRLHHTITPSHILKEHPKVRRHFGSSVAPLASSSSHGLSPVWDFYVSTGELAGKNRKSRRRDASDVESDVEIQRSTRPSPLNEIPGLSLPPAALVVSSRQPRLQRWIDEEMDDERRTIEASRSRDSNTTIPSGDVQRPATRRAAGSRHQTRTRSIDYVSSVGPPAYEREEEASQFLTPPPRYTQI